MAQLLLDASIPKDDHAVGTSGELGVVGDDDKGLPQLGTEVEEELV